MTEETNPANPPPVRIVKTSPEENVIRRDLLRHALDEGSFARYIVENFRRNDFPGVGDIFDALKRSVQETGAVDRKIVGEAVGWDPFYEFERRLPEIVQTGDHWSVAKSEMRKQIRTALHDAFRDQDDARAFALVDRLREPAAVPVEATPEPVGEITEAEVEDFIQTVEQNAKKELLGFKTSIYPLDMATSGFIGGETWAVSAPTGGGKTQLLSQFVNEVALQNGRVMYLSLEMPVRRILARLVGANVARNPKKIIEGRSGMPREMLRNKVRFFQAQRIIVRDDLLELTQIERFVRDHVKRGEPLDMVVIDFLQNVALKGVSMQIERMATAAVLNYEHYQGDDEGVGQATGHPTGHPSVTDKKLKKESTPSGVADANAAKGKPRGKTFYDEHGRPYQVLPSRPPDPEDPQLNDQAEEAEERR